MGFRIALFAVLLALGAFALEWMQRALWTGSLNTGLAVTLAAFGFAALGLWLGSVLYARRARAERFERNEAAINALGLTRREMETLSLLAEGLSNKEIARRLDRSPNTVKTHAAHLYAKLEVQSRLAAISKARALSLIP
jgi:ATP/maltotriose-dependent transcriptional regulator MalT